MDSGRRRIRMAELVAIIVVLAVLALVFLPLVRQSRNAVAWRPCVNNLKQWGAIFSLYVHEHSGKYPPVHGFEPFMAAENAYHCTNVHDDFDFCPDLRAVYPEYATDLGLLVCPDGPHLEEPVSIAGFRVRPHRVDVEALGILERVGMAACAYEGAITNGDLSYTYFGRQFNYPDTGGHHVNRGKGERLGLPATGPSEVVAMLAYVERCRDNPPVRRKRRQPPVDVREQPIDLHSLIAPGLDFEKLFPPCSQPGSPANIRSPRSMNPLWAGWYFLEQEALDEAARANATPPVREWHATMPIMWDTVLQTDPRTPYFVHDDPAGLNVLYMDGHVEFVEYPGRFPATENFATMKRIDPMRRID